jgi:hypothetical protein
MEMIIEACFRAWCREQFSPMDEIRTAGTVCKRLNTIFGLPAMSLKSTAENLQTRDTGAGVTDGLIIVCGNLHCLSS